jgi:hypothetical protein
MDMKILFLLSLLLIGSKELFAQELQGPLDGKQFKIELFVGGKSDSKETLIFDKGMMDPVDCHQWGFAATKYEGKKSAEWSSFHATCKSDKEGTMVWQGKITADKIDGTVVWSKSGQDPITYTFNGKEAAAEK